MHDPESSAKNSSAEPSPFFITGGTLPLDAASYVARAADDELYQSLRRGEFCYVLNTRQMGKSSLMIRTARRLREDGREALILDLTGVGQNLTVEQWYFGLLDLAAVQTGHEEELFAFWKTHKDLGAMQRFVAALRRVLLASQTHGGAARDVVIFVDEIDAVRSLAFSADEFFAGIRECCNRNAHEPEGARLTFCLLGVATPSDLIRDTRVTPFNIGRRIELHDFTTQEAAPLAFGLRPYRSEWEADLLLERILYWTGGQPYMTQRLCRAVAEHLAGSEQAGSDGGGKYDPIEDTALVDGLCQHLFLTKSARESDDNLAFVRTRLLHSEADRAALLDLYAQIQRGKRVRDDETNPLCPVLRLSGVVRAKNGWLVLRNEIYSRVFDSAWIAENMPDAEVRRQKRAYRLGVLRTAAVGSVVVIIMAGLAGFAFQQSRNAAAAAKRAREQEQLANSRLSRSYVDSGLRMMEAQNYGGALAPLVEAMKLDQGDAARMETHRLRFESILAHAPHLERMWFAGSPVKYAAFSPDKARVAAASENGEVHVWEVATGAELPLGIRHDAAVNFLAFSPDNTRLATCSEDGKIQVWDMTALKLQETLFIGTAARDHIPRAFSVTWSQNSRRLAATGYAECRVWEMNAGPGGKAHLLKDISIGEASIRSAAFSPDGQFLSYVCATDSGEQVNLTTGRQLTLGDTRTNVNFYGLHVEYSSDGQNILVAGTFGDANQHFGGAVYKAGKNPFLPPQKNLRWFLPHDDDGLFATYSPDGKRIVTTSRDRTARIWDAVTGKPLTRGLMHNGSVQCAIFSPDNRRVATASADGKVQVWNVQTGEQIGSPLRHGGAVVSVAFGQDSAHLMSAGRDGSIRLWSLTDTDPTLPVLTVSDCGFQRLADDTHLLYTDHFKKKSRTFLYDIVRGARQLLDDGTKERGKQSGFTTQWKCSIDRRYAVVYRDHIENAQPRAQVWDALRGVQLGPPVEADGAVLSRTGQKILFQQDNGPAWVADVASSKRLRSGLSASPSPIGKVVISDRTFLAFTPNEDAMAMTDRAGNVWMEEIATGKMLTPKMRHSKPVYNAYFAPSGQHLFTVTTAGDVQVWNAKTGHACCPPQPCGRTPDIHPRIIFAPDGKTAFLGLHWRLEGADTVRWKDVDRSSMAIFSPDSARFVTLAQGLLIRDAVTGDAITAKIETGSQVRSMAFSPDSRRIIAGCDDGTARVWDAQTGQPLSAMIEHGRPILYTLFSPNGRQIVTLSQNGLMRFWDAATMEPLTPALSFAGHDCHIEFTDDGMRLLVASTHEMRMWTRPPLTRSLSEMEAYAELLSGQRIDAQLGMVPVDTAQLRAAWQEVQ